MGTIFISQYQSAGSRQQGDQPVPRANPQTRGFERTDTATSANSITLRSGYSFVSVYAAEKHRISFGSNTTATSGEYDTVQAGERRDFAIDPASVIFFRTDA